ncbi:MAG TPA: hypothetical protein VHM67_02225 [Gemmatimonadaceae bacterium]|nr:hypothetical protein [Gemmatimonadaceae bacterium]
MSAVRPEDAIERWLEGRTPRPPDALLARVAVALRAEDRSAPVADRALAASEALLRRLLAEDCTTRDTAPDLLAADALVTYAFEADTDAGTDPAAVDARAAAAMRRISRLAAE